MNKRKLQYLYPLILLCYSAFSYIFVDRNIVWSSHPLYWNWQQSAWACMDNNRLLLSLTFILIVGIATLSYLALLRAIKKNELDLRQFITLLASCILVLSLSYPALSHDVFNYMFNAKMVLNFQANPHVQVALDFPDHPWLRFMHNTHTPAPYGYGWTALSLIPSWLAQENLKLNIFAFRFTMIAALLGLLATQWKLMQQKKVAAFKTGQKNRLYLLALFALNPLVLIETVGNIHNDVVMMLLSLLAGLSFVKFFDSTPSARPPLGIFPLKRGRNAYWLILSTLLFAASVSIKFATLTMVGGLGLWVGVRLTQKQRKYSNEIFKSIRKLIRKSPQNDKPLSLGTAFSLALFSPLFTARSQRFLPWYMIWPLSWIFASREKWWQELMIAFSVSSLLGYVPYLYHGKYSPELLTLRSIIIFVPPLSYVGTRLLLRALKSPK